MAIHFSCPNGHKLKVDDIHGGKISKCPTCREDATAPTVEAYALTKELSEILAVVVECENNIKDGSHCVETVKQRIQAIADPNEIMAKVNAGDKEWIEAYKKESRRVSEVDTIDIKRLHKLRNQHPNDSRVIQLGRRAADCFLKLSDIHLTACEEMDGTNAYRKQEDLKGAQELISLMFPRAGGYEITVRSQVGTTGQHTNKSPAKDKPVSCVTSGHDGAITVPSNVTSKTLNTYFKVYWICIAAGYPLSLFLIGIPVIITGIVFAYMLLYQLWKLIPADIARTTPSKAVGFTFIPFFNFYWIFVAYKGLGEDMNKTLQRRGVEYKVNEDLGLVFCILCLACLIPYVGILGGIASMIVLIFFLKSVKNGAIALLEHEGIITSDTPKVIDRGRQGHIESQHEHERVERQEREEEDRRRRREADERYKQNVQSGRISSEMCPHCNASTQTCSLLINLQNQSSQACRNFYQMYTMMDANPARVAWRAEFCSTSKWTECGVNVNEQRGHHR